MKLLPLALAATVLVAVTVAPLRAATPGATEITVSGTGSVSLAPDLATVQASIHTNAPDSAAAVGRNNEIYQRLAAAVEKLGVAHGDVELQGYNMYYNPKPSPAPDSSHPVYGQDWGYNVNRSFTIKVRDVAKAGKIVDACTNAGATNIGGVSFGLANPGAARSEAIARAMKDARATAEALASAAGLHLIGIKSVNYGGGFENPQPMMRMAAMAPPAATPPPTQFEATNVTENANVNVVFLAQP